MRRACALSRLLSLRNQHHELQQVFDTKVRASSRDRLEHIACRYAGPGRWNAPEFIVLIAKVDAILAPGCAFFNQLEGLPAQGMKGMRDPKRVCLIDRITCS